MAGGLQNEDIATAAELVSDGGSASQLPNASKIWVSAFGKTLAQAITDQDIGAPPTFIEEIITLDATMISNGYIDLTGEAVAGGLWVYGPNQEYLASVRHYSTSIVSLVTRITWTGGYEVGADKALVETNDIFVKYIQA